MENDKNNDKETAQAKKSFVPKMVLLIVVGAILGLWIVAMRSGPPGLPSSPRLNKLAPVFTLEDLVSGKSVALTDLRGAPLLINFWASWCISCREEAAILESLSHELEPVGVKILGIAIQDRRKDALKFMKKYGQTFQSLLDPPGSVAVDYGVLGVPETFVLDPQGVVVDRIIGVVDKRQVYGILEKMGWHGKPVSEVAQ